MPALSAAQERRMRVWCTTVGRVLNARLFLDCELRVFVQNTIKRTAGKRTHNEFMITPFTSACAQDRKHARILDLTRVPTTCMHVPTAINH